MCIMGKNKHFHRVTVNKCAKYLCQRSLVQKLLSGHTHTHTYTWPTAMCGPPKWSVMRNCDGRVGRIHKMPRELLCLFANFPMFADSFSVLSIHCVARGLGASLISVQVPHIAWWLPATARVLFSFTIWLCDFCGSVRLAVTGAVN